MRVEDTRRENGEVELLVAVPPEFDVRRAGGDIRAGEVVLDRGLRLGPAELGVLASVGAAAVRVARRPRVAVVTTGDELVAVDAALPPGGVRNSGRYVIPALAERAGATTVSIAHARDDPALVRDTIAAALDAADVTVITGGMSVGVHDHVGAALAELGVQTHFAGVALRPGKPTSFGTRGAALAFGLPGNPVSSLMTFLLFARPALLALAGERPDRERTVARLEHAVERTPRRVHAVRCSLRLERDGWRAVPTGPQASHVLTSMIGADAFALIEAGEGEVAAGSEVEVELLYRERSAADRGHRARRLHEPGIADVVLELLAPDGVRGSPPRARRRRRRRASPRAGRFRAARTGTSAAGRRRSRGCGCSRRRTAPRPG